jgi:hypothetical protein
VGNGYATEAGRAAIDYAFEVLQVDEVISLIRPENTGSIRVAERLGERHQTDVELLGEAARVYSARRQSAEPETCGSDGPSARTRFLLLTSRHSVRSRTRLGHWLASLGLELDGIDPASRFRFTRLPDRGATTTTLPSPSPST